MTLKFHSFINYVFYYVLIRPKSSDLVEKFLCGMFLLGRKVIIWPKSSYWAHPLYLSRAFFLFGSKRYPLGHRHFLPSWTNGSKQLFGDIYSIFRENYIFTQIKNLVRKLLKKSWSYRESSRISGTYLNMSIFGVFRSTGK